MSREFRVFLSSTFRDLQAERDYLLKNVFPSIRQLCRERGVEFTEIDLRWGVTKEEAILGRVIRACMDEIDRCRPYFIGILGDRYGWAPQLHEVQKDGDLMRTYPWIEDAVLERQSLLELEFTHALLNAPIAEESIVCYRHSTSSEQDTDALSDHNRILSLRKRVTDHGYAPREFKTPEELGVVIYRHLVGILDRDFPADTADNELHLVRRSHEAFAASRRQAYIADPRQLARLSEHADGIGAPLVVVAPSGYGKSALLAYWIDWYRRKHPDAFVISHFVGVGMHGEAGTAIIKHCILEIKARCGIADPMPESAAQLEADFSTWLARTGDTTIIIVIDAINQLGGDTVPAWLPRVVPEQVRLIVSTTPGFVADALTERGWQSASVNALTEAHREALIVRFFGEYRKGLNTEQCKRIAHDDKTSVALFLRVMLEELRLSGSFELLDSRIGHYLAAGSLEELFQRVLERMESDHGPDVVRRVLTAIWVARRGLSEVEIAAVVNVTATDIRELMQAFEYHLLWRDGLRTFFHEYLREAVEARYLPQEADRRRAHLMLASYFSALPLSARRADEEPWQWRAAEEWEALRNCLADIPMFEQMYAPDAAHELLGYWLAMGDRYDMAEEYMKSMATSTIVESGPGERARLYNLMGNYFSSSSKFEKAEVMLRTALELYRAEFGGIDARTVSCMNDLGGVLYYLRQYDAAESLWNSVLTIQEDVLGTDSPALWSILENLTALLYTRSRYAESEALSRRSLLISELQFGADSIQTSQCLNNLASAQTNLGNLEEAASTMKRSIQIKRSRLGERHPEIGRSMINLGTICERMGQLEEAERITAAALVLLDNSVGPAHEWTISAMVNLAHLYAIEGKFSEADRLFASALEAVAKTSGNENPLSVVINILVADRLRREGRFNDSIAHYRQYLALYRNLLGAQHPMVVEHMQNMVEMLRAQGQEEEAITWTRFPNQNRPPS